MTVSVVVNNPAQTISLDMIQEQPTQVLSLLMAGTISLSAIVSNGTVTITSPLGLGTLSLQRQPRSEIDMLLDQGGMVIDFMLNEYIWKV